MNTDVSLFQLVRKAYREMTAAVERHTGMGYARVQVLLLLEREGELSQAELQRRLAVDGAAVTRHVKQLEEDGLVRRRADPAVNRFTLVCLTDAGHARAGHLARLRPLFESHFTAGMEPADVAALRDSLARVRKNAREWEVTPAHAETPG